MEDEPVEPSVDVESVYVHTGHGMRMDELMRELDSCKHLAEYTNVHKVVHKDGVVHLY